MPDHFPDNRMLPGAVAPQAVEHYESQTVSLSNLVGVLRRRWRLILMMTVVGVGIGGFLAVSEPPNYQASGLIRLAGERRQLTGDVNAEDPKVDLGRTMDPMLSLVELVRSRSVMGAVVDSLGLQLTSIDPEDPAFAATRLADVQIDPRVGADSIMLDFAPDKVTAEFAGRKESARYGEVLRLGAVRFTVPARPVVTHAIIAVHPREQAIGALQTAVLVTPKTGTDVIEISYQSTDRGLSARVVNNVISSFQTLNVQSAKEKSKRRRVFLEEQFTRTDSMLTRAQSELAKFRSRQQLASSASKLEAAQSAMITLQGRRSELEADQKTFASLLGKLKSGSDADRAEALRALATSPALGDNPSVSQLFTQLNNAQFRLDSMTTGQWAAAPSNPDVIQLRSLIKLYQGQPGPGAQQPARLDRGAHGRAERAQLAKRAVDSAAAGHGRRGDAPQPAGRCTRQPERRPPPGLSARQDGRGSGGRRYRRGRSGGGALHPALDRRDDQARRRIPARPDARRRSGFPARGAQHLDSPARGYRNRAAPARPRRHPEAHACAPRGGAWAAS